MTVIIKFLALFFRGRAQAPLWNGRNIPGFPGAARPGAGLCRFAVLPGRGAGCACARPRKPPSRSIALRRLASVAARRLGRQAVRRARLVRHPSGTTARRTRKPPEAVHENACVAGVTKRRRSRCSPTVRLRPSDMHRSLQASPDGILSGEGS